MRGHSGFTLIELMIVVAIIAILAGISVPNFLEAQTRSKIARVQCDMSTVRAALRAYSAQYEACPPNRPEVRNALQAIRDKGLPAPSAERPVAAAGRLDFLEQSGWALTPLTTPNAWLARSLPVDPFYSSSRGASYWEHPPAQPFVYINRYGLFQNDRATTAALDGKGFMLVSYGPDHSLNLPDPLSDQPIAYDPTNGTTSEGDLVMTGW